MNTTEAIENLRNVIGEGRVYTNLRHVSASGMTRWISLHIVQDGEIRDITRRAAIALGWKYDDNHEAIKVGGVGMDMGFHLVYSLSGKLHEGDGYKIKQSWL